MSESKVYFILSPALQLVKIGKSSNLKKRLETLQSHSADDLQLLLSLPTWAWNAAFKTLEEAA